MVRFVRQPNRVIGALATPLVFWLLIGAGMGNSMRFQGHEQVSYLSYFFPGAIVMVLLFTAIFSTISIIEDRREGFLQCVLVAPVSRSAIAMGKILGGTLLATAQGCAFLALAWIFTLHFTLSSALVALAAMTLVSFALTALGFCIAWRMTSTHGFHAIMNLFLMPMWFLSGALFPAAAAWGPLRWVMFLNPLTYGLASVRGAIDLASGQVAAGHLTLMLGVTAGFAVVMYLAAVWIASRPSAADLA